MSGYKICRMSGLNAWPDSKFEIHPDTGYPAVYLIISNRIVFLCSLPFLIVFLEVFFHPPTPSLSVSNFPVCLSVSLSMSLSLQKVVSAVQNDGRVCTVQCGVEAPERGHLGPQHHLPPQHADQGNQLN